MQYLLYFLYENDIKYPVLVLVLKYKNGNLILMAHYTSPSKN